MGTNIEWCNETWNPITGCTKISPACEHCYAQKAAYSGRLRGRFGYPQDEPFRVTFHPDKLDKPLKWKKPRTIFVCSMGDIFHRDAKSRWIDDILDVISATPQHTYLMLTKRPDNIAHKIYGVTRNNPCRSLYGGDFLPNLWIGVTAENQAMADQRIPELIKQTDGMYKLFVSCEPLLGPVDLSPWIDKIDWVVVGGETGQNARPINLMHFIDIELLCKKHKTPYFFKQWGKNWGGCTNLDNYGLREVRRREFPASLKHKE